MQVNELIAQLNKYDQDLPFSVCVTVADDAYTGQAQFTEGFVLREEKIYHYNKRIYNDEIELFEDIMIDNDFHEDDRVKIDEIISNTTQYNSVIMHLNVL